MISIIVPVYNVEKYIERCLECLIRQTEKDIEIILIDDGPTDRTKEICDSYAKKYSNMSVVHKKNEGVSSARNLGIELSKGEYIAFVDADDSVDLNFFEVLLNCLKESKSDVAACAVANEYNAHYEIKKSHSEMLEYTVFDGNETVLDGVTVLGGYIWNKLWKRSLIGEHRFSDSISMCEDLLFLWETLKDSNRACYVEMNMYHYLIHFESLSHSSNIEKYREALQIQEKIIKEAEELGLKSVSGLIVNYLNWNLKLSEIMVVSKQCDKNMYCEIKNNLARYHKYFCKCDFRRHLLANALLISWTAYSILAKTISTIKKLYMLKYTLK